MVVRDMFDATVSGYLYHKTGRECWLDHQGTPNPFQRKANTNDWLRRFNWTKTVVKVPVPANIRSLDMCQALNSTDETIGIGIYLEFAREKFYRSVAKLKSRTKDPTLFVCYDDILSDGGRVQTERRIRSFIGQSLNASATSGDKLRRRLNLAGHSTDPDPELRARLRDIARNIDCTYFGCETTAWNDALEECRDETTMAAAPSSGNGTQSKEELMSSFPNETKATRENVVDDPHARDHHLNYNPIKLEEKVVMHPEVLNSPYKPKLWDKNVDTFVKEWTEQYHKWVMNMHGNGEPLLYEMHPEETRLRHRGDGGHISTYYAIWNAGGSVIEASAWSLDQRSNSVDFVDKFMYVDPREHDWPSAPTIDLFGCQAAFHGWWPK